MRIRVKAVISGTRNGLDWPAVGEELDVPGEEGAQLCASGAADPVATEAPAERAVVTKSAEKRK